MRILHVSPTYLPAVRYGGPIFAVHGLCRALVRRGHHVEVFTTNVDGPHDSDVSLDTPVLRDGVVVRYFPSGIMRRLYWSPPLARAMNAEIDNFDCIHLHSVFLWPTWAAARSAYRGKVPYLISPRGMLVKELIQGRNTLIKQGWINLIEKRNLKRAAGLHVTSGLEKEELERFQWNLPPITVVPNGIDDRETYGPGEISGDVQEVAAVQPFVLFFGRISWKKGLDRLLCAFSHVKVGNLVIVGPDDENLAPSLIKQANELGLGNRVRLLTRTVLGSDKEFLFRVATLFVLSSYSENFGNSVLEAMQRGLPVVVTPEVAAADIVRRASGGFVVAGEQEPLSAAMSQILSDRLLAHSLGEAGARYVIEHYKWDRVVLGMEALYERVTKRA